MAENMNPSFNQDFFVDPKKHKDLLKKAREIFEDPSKIASADIAESSPENPALASKLFLSAYTRALKEEARKVDEKQQPTVLEELNAKYSVFVTEYRKKNERILNSLLKSKKTEANSHDNERIWKKHRQIV